MLDITKPVKLRGGTKVRIISTEGSKHYPIVGLIGENLCPSCWTMEGKSDIDQTGGPYHNDLINVESLEYLYYNLYSEGLSFGYDSAESSDNYKRSDRVARIQVKIECKDPNYKAAFLVISKFALQIN